jgi:hypothetical protein
LHNRFEQVKFQTTGCPIKLPFFHLEIVDWQVIQVEFARGMQVMLLMLVPILDCSGLINSGCPTINLLDKGTIALSTHNKETSQLLLREITQPFCSFVRYQQDIEITLEVKQQTTKGLELGILYENNSR